MSGAQTTEERALHLATLSAYDQLLLRSVQGGVVPKPFLSGRPKCMSGTGPAPPPSFTPTEMRRFGDNYKAPPNPLPKLQVPSAPWEPAQYSTADQTRRPQSSVPKVESAVMSYELDDLVGRGKQLERKVAIARVGRTPIGKAVLERHANPDERPSTTQSARGHREKGPRSVRGGSASSTFSARSWLPTSHLQPQQLPEIGSPRAQSPRRGHGRPSSHGAYVVPPPSQRPRPESAASSAAGSCLSSILSSVAPAGYGDGKDNAPVTPAAAFIATCITDVRRELKTNPRAAGSGGRGLTHVDATASSPHQRATLMHDYT